MRRRRFLAVVAALAGATSSAVLLRPRSAIAASSRRSALERLCSAMAPGAPGLPGARSLDAARALPGSLLRAAAALLDEVARTDALDEATLGQLLARHPVEGAAVRTELYRLLYGSVRHGGRGAAGAFATLRYP
jgi:hypothetical protein